MLIFQAIISFVCIQQNSQAASSDNIFDKNACGPICLATVAQYIGRQNAAERIFQILPPTGKPRTLNDLNIAAKKLGIFTAAIRWRRGTSLSLPGPAIIHLNPRVDRQIGHFVVLLKLSGGRVQILDIPGHPTWISLEQLWMEWDGIALHVADSAARLPLTRSALPMRLGAAVAVALGIISLSLITSVRRKTTDALLHGGSPHHRPSAIGSSRLALSAAVPATIVALSVWLLTTRTETQADDRPPLEVSPKFCVIKPPGQTTGLQSNLSALYRIKNNLKEIATIKQVGTTCGCATPKLSAITIPPGGEIEVKVAVKPTVEGSKAFKIMIYFSRPEKEILELHGTIDVSQR